MAEVLATRTTAEWLMVFREADIPAVPMHDLDTLIDDPHLAAVGFFQALDHPTEGRIRLVGIPSRWSRSRLAIVRHPPNLGEHTAEVLREVGMSAAAIARLAAAGAIGASPLPERERVTREARRVRVARSVSSGSESPSPRPSPLRGEGEGARRSRRPR